MSRALIDVQNAELYASSYALQKDVLRHTTEYITEGLIQPEVVSA